ncbi:MAG: ABC transporter substrate-binding protein [Chloroflexota bacterium]
MYRKLILSLVFLGLLLAACQSGKTTEETSSIITGSPNVESTNKVPVMIRIVVLPLIDTLPMYVAQQEGLFANNGIEVEFIPVASAPERDQILQAGQADATVNEILSDMFFNKNGIQLQVVRYAHMASLKSAHFFILASANSKILSVEGLKGIEIGISQGTIIEYVTDRLLQAQGFSSDEIRTISVPKMPDRMALLASSELDAAVLPDPLADLSVQQGSTIILDDSQYPTFGASVISFSKRFIDENPLAVKGFLAAIEEATIIVNENPEKYANLLSEKQLVPQPLLGTYQVPAFPMAGITSEAEWNDALTWVMEKGLLTVKIPYSDSVNPGFLP